jgi:hypothetical protein
VVHCSWFPQQLFLLEVSKSRSCGSLTARSTQHVDKNRKQHLTEFFSLPLNINKEARKTWNDVPLGNKNSSEMKAIIRNLADSGQRRGSDSLHKQSEFASTTSTFQILPD